MFRLSVAITKPSDCASQQAVYCAYEAAAASASRQHQGELMQFAWLQLTDVIDFVEAKHEGAICRHLTGPL